jgi:hypothetical protein
MPCSPYHRHASGGTAAFLLLFLTATASPAFSQVPPDDALLKSRQRQFETLKGSAARMEKLDAVSIKEVVNFRLPDGKQLVVETPKLDELPDRAPSKTMRLELKDLSGVTTLMAGPVLNVPVPRPPPRAGPNGVPPNGPMVLEMQRVRIFTLTHQAIPNPNEFVDLSVRSNPSSLAISHRKYWNGGEQRLDLELPQGMGLRVNAGITFRIYRRNAGEKAQSSQFSEPDFATLLRAHPVEAEKYIRPLLRDLGQGDLAGVEDAVAAQVLAELMPADDVMRQQVTDMLPLLDDPDFRVRERTGESLKKLQMRGAMVLRKVDRKGLTPEQTRAVDVLLAAYSQLTPKEVERLRADKSFLLDCLSSKDVAIRKAALVQLQKVVGQEVQFDPAALEEDRAAALVKLREQLLK